MTMAWSENNSVNKVVPVAEVEHRLCGVPHSLSHMHIISDAKFTTVKATESLRFCSGSLRIFCRLAGRLFLETKVHQRLRFLCTTSLCIYCSLFSFLVTATKCISVFIKTKSLQQSFEGI